MNPNLVDAARKHTAYVIANPGSPDPHTETVNGVNIGPSERMIAAGYSLPSGGSENIWTALGIVGQDNILEDLTALQQGPFLDAVNGGVPGRGHRVNLMNGGANEVGLGLGEKTSTSGNTNIISHIVTQDFANAGKTSFLCGVAFNDTNRDDFYQPGEELAGVTITATRTTDNAVFTTNTWGSGGYSLALAPGTYAVTAAGANVGSPAQQMVTITNQNVESDFISTNSPPLAGPTIVTQPTSQSKNPNLLVRFTVAFNGAPPATVQWTVKAPGANSFTPLAGETGATLTVRANDSTNGNQYQAVITNSQGSVTTDPATLTVTPTFVPVQITTLPTNQTVNVGDTVTFTTVGTGATQIQWAVSNNGGPFTDIPGATSPNLTFVADASKDSTTYKVTYSNNTGASSSRSANLTVNAQTAAPTITAQPIDQTAQDGTATLDFVTQAYPAPTIQWQVAGTGRGAFSNVQGGTHSSLTVEAPANGKLQKYRAIITNGIGRVTTRTVTVTGNLRSPASNDLTNLQTASQAALDAITACRKATDASQAKLQADLQRLNASASAKKALTSIAANEAAARSTFRRNEFKFLKKIHDLAATVFRDWLLARKSPHNQALATQLQHDLTRLRKAAKTSTAPADATACKLATLHDLAPISAVRPADHRLQADVIEAQTNAFNIGQALQAPIVIAQDIVTRLQSDTQ